MIGVWQKQMYESVKKIPHLQAKLVYQLAEDKQRAYCEMRFATPYSVAQRPSAQLVIKRYSDHQVVCWYVVPDGKFATLRIDHPDTAIYGCTTCYNRNENPPISFFLPTFNMDITVEEGQVSMPQEGGAR